MNKTCTVFAMDTICACNYKCKQSSLDISDWVTSCQKGCQLAHLGQSNNNCNGDFICKIGWNIFNGDDHNGGSGVTIYDDDIN